MIDRGWRPIGIERGKRFDPNAKTKEILTDAIQEARAWFEARYDIIPPFYEGRRWFFPSTEELVQSVMKDWHVPDPYPIDARGTAYSLAFFSAKHLGESQYYLLADKTRMGMSCMVVLRPGEGAVRKDVEAVGHREGLKRIFRDTTSADRV